MQQGVFGRGPGPAGGSAGPRAVVVRAVATVVVRDLTARAAPGEPGLGPYRAAQPAGRLGRVGGIGCAPAALQQPDPDGLFQVGRVHSGARGLRLRLRGEQRAQFVDEVGVLQQVHAERDEWAAPGGFPTGRGPLVREAALSR
ncbi:hypothetical protein ADK94_05955 [Streptomyces sp. XY593]|nr:hypothetical protein ADK94_05955 [Streptomyces sp. XY593]